MTRRKKQLSVPYVIAEQAPSCTQLLVLNEQYKIIKRNGKHSMLKVEALCVSQSGPSASTATLVLHSVQSLRVLTTPPHSPLHEYKVNVDPAQLMKG